MSIGLDRWTVVRFPFPKIVVVLGELVYFVEFTNFDGWNFYVPVMATQVGQVVSLRPDKNNCFFPFLVVFIFSCSCPLIVVSPSLLHFLCLYVLLGFAVVIWHICMCWRDGKPQSKKFKNLKKKKKHNSHQLILHVHVNNHMFLRNIIKENIKWEIIFRT